MVFLDLGSGTIVPVTGSEELGSPRWSPDGRHISAIRYASNEVPRLMLFDVETGKWKEQARTQASWQRWSHDGKYVNFVKGLEERSILRISISDNKASKIQDLRNFRAADPCGQWFSLGLEDEPIVFRNTGGGTEIYALEWNAP